MLGGSRSWRQRFAAGIGAGVLVLTGAAAVPPAQAAGDPCASGNAIACENSKPGDDPSVWDLANGSAGDQSIQGFATTMSALPGGTIGFKIKAAVNSPYTIDIYRLGYYVGKGARRQAPTITVNSPKSQPACISDPSTNNFDCGNWSLSTQWTVPSAAVSGVYIATLNQGNSWSQITFVVRNDSSRSDVVFKTSDATWQAYNTYGGSSFYVSPDPLGSSQARAYKISYNRPFATRGWQDGRDFLFSNEYPTLRFLERNGVDVSYTTDIDLSAGTASLTNHKVFMSVGHDEYWTLSERQRVEAARDAGVNLMFLSGNEVYWHTRLEPSIDGTSTANRTLVCYKDSWEAAPIDPSPEGTGTWRDPRFKAAPNGSNPENALTGTIYMSNFTDLAITVSEAQGKSRLWRGTSLATLPAGGSATLAPHTVGYESDEDIDNGHRPAGLMRLSETTGPTPQLVQDPAGTQVAAGTTTHSVTLYRAASGALVFGAGTVQWGWGLDQYHDGDNSNPADSRMQQATLNMLADMGTLPTTLMAGLTMPAENTDVQAPTVTVTAPGGGATIQNGSKVTVSGTASDVGGGTVTAVEVSLDGGTTYRRAVGTTSWSYTGVMHGTGSSSIKVRASDDSANLSPTSSVGVTVACPCSIYGEAVPQVAAADDADAVELGVKFVPDADGYIGGIRFYKGPGNTGTHTGTLWSGSGQALATATFTGETASGWQVVTFSSAVPVTAGVTYVASYYAPNGHYAADSGYFSAADVEAPPLKAPGRASGAINGVFAAGHRFPTSSWRDTNYWVDVIYTKDDTTPPTVASVSPLPGATSVPSTAVLKAVFSTTIKPYSLSLVLKESDGTTVPGNVTFDGATRTATFTPVTVLDHSANYTATVTATSAAGVPMTTPYTWSFTTAQTDPLPGVCPCSIWSDSATPDTLSDPDSDSVELGVKFTSDVDGQVSAVRFFKGPGNLGTHTGSLWTASGALLGTVSFTNESASGWQTAYFSSPINVTAGTVYIVSYRAPMGGYALTANGLSTAVDSAPLHTVPGGGVYSYGSGAPLQPSLGNYWVDLVFNATDAAPTIASTAPGASATNVHVNSTVTSTFQASIKQGTGTLVVKSPDGSPVPGALTYDAARRTFTFTPSDPLTASTTYQATVSGATALSGQPMEPHSWSFTTAGLGACPCTLFESTAVPPVADSGDPDAVELGVSFTPSADGQVTGVRFYKSASNTGTHTGSLWSPNGTRLATGTFSNETASGWQTLTFEQPVAVVSGTTYIASYFAPQGHYAIGTGFFDLGWQNGPLTASAVNGLYAYGSAGGFPTENYGRPNYYVDPIFDSGAPADPTPPSVISMSPPDGSSSQPVTRKVTVTFDEAVSAESLSLTVKRRADDAAVAGSTSYTADTRTATFSASDPLAPGTTYTVTVSASDLAGNAMTAPKTWSFSTALPDPTPGVCPCSIWTDATTPEVLAAPDSTVEVGTAFTADTDGYVQGVRFYKGAANAGPHVVSLWSSGGPRLATATSTSETAEGWQTVTFDTPIEITAGTTYVVSYLAVNGNYSVTSSGLAAAIDRSPLHSLATGGRYTYGGGFPSSSSSSNYWVDPVFTTGGGSTQPPDTTPPSITGAGASGSGTTATISWITDESSSSKVDYGITTALGSTGTGAAGTQHTVALTGLAANTRYYYRVTSTDAAGNTAIWPATGQPPASWAPAVAPIVHSTVADFAAGSGAYISDTSGGEIMAAPAAGAEFSGTALPAGWSSSVLASGGKTTVSGGLATLDGTRLSSASTYSASRSFTAAAQLSPGASIGWGSTAALSTGVRAAFAVSSSGAVSAVFNDGRGVNTTKPIPGTGIDTSHEFRIDWSSTSATMFIDGVQVAANSFRPSVGLRFLAADPTKDSGQLLVDWVRIGPYAGSSTYTSAVIDGLTSVGWDTVTADVQAASGSTVTLKVRSGNTAKPGSKWTAWTNVPSSGSISRNARYLQYQVVTSTSGTRFVSSATKSVTIGFHVL